MAVRDDTGFVSVGRRDNFYQTCLFMPMAFALVTTVHEDGETGIGPHALVAPFGITRPWSLLLISRSNSGTATNLRRTGRCALNYLEFDRERLDAIARLGQPGQKLEDKQKDMPFTLIPAPVVDHTTPPDRDAPLVIAEAFQVIECTLDRSFDLDREPANELEIGANHFILEVEQILLHERFRNALDGSGPFPSMPVFYGYRPEGGFWFAEHKAPFAVSPPRVEGMELQGIYYQANRLDEDIRFTQEACAVFTRVPRPFVRAALLQVVEAARTAQVRLVDEAFVRSLNRQRG